MWRMLSLRLPSAILLAAAAKRETVKSHRVPTRVRLLQRQITPTEPIALLHLHLKAGLSFDFLWSHLMTRREGFDKRKSLENPEGITHWNLWISRARSARHWLAEQLRLNFRPDSPRRFTAIHQFYSGLVEPFDDLTERDLWRKDSAALDALRSAEIKGQFWRRDPLWCNEDIPEIVFLARAFDFSENTYSKDKIFTLVLIQYIRVQCILHEYLVQDIQRPGLDAFVQVFDRIKPYRKGINEETYLDAATMRNELNLQAIEPRTAPPNNLSEARKHISRVRDLPIEAGWVYHLIRDLDSDKSFTQQHRAITNQGEQLCRMLRHNPYWLAYFRGVDVASLERNGPLWLVADILRDVLRASAKASQQTGLRPLGLTLHAGEDFKHLLSGLRAIHEPFEYGLMRRDDRLGHGLALGLDPAQWVERNPEVFISPWIRLLDLDWALGLVRRDVLDLPKIDLYPFAEERQQLIKQLKLAPIFEHLSNYNDSLHNFLGSRGIIKQIVNQGNLYCESLKTLRLKFPKNIIEMNNDALILKHTSRDLPLLIAIQKWLSTYISYWQTVIEINPSSNFVIGGLRVPLDQPLFQLRSENLADPMPVPVVLSTDDPLQFATNLEDEFAYAWAGMVASGRPAGFARERLKEMAHASWTARFTIPKEV
ncbi:hypothetical protein KKB55_10950 [Myxococcota bacterium]|nr:hypothetical protein [Myxococcota bacterium]MBU1898254.1 hypothetical protein [Myxococcota bacterium]